MGEVASFTEAAGMLAPLGGEVIAVRGAAQDLAAASTGELTFAAGVAVTIRYRKFERQSLSDAVLYGVTARDIIRELCRTLQRVSDDIRAVAPQDDERGDVSMIEISPGRPNAGLRLARVSGVHPDQLNAAMGDDASLIVLDPRTGVESRSFLASPSIREIVWRLTHRTGLEKQQLVARPAGTPEPWDLTTVHIADGHPEADRKVAQVRGVTFTQLNIALGRPVKRVEQWHDSGHVDVLFDPDAPSRRAARIAQSQP